MVDYIYYTFQNGSTREFLGMSDERLPPSSLNGAAMTFCIPLERTRGIYALRAFYGDEEKLSMGYTLNDAYAMALALCEDGADEVKIVDGVKTVRTVYL